MSKQCQMSNEEAKLIALQAVAECQFDVDVTDLHIEEIRFDNDEVDASQVDLFNKKSNDLAFKYVMSL